MGLRFSKRIETGDGVGVNISKSGLSASFRGKYGSFGTRGFSLRTGILGLTFRKSWASNLNGGGLGALVIILLSFIFVYIAYNILLLVFLIIYNLFIFIIDAAKYTIRIIRIKVLEGRLRKNLMEYEANPLHKFIKFSTANYPERLKDVPFYLLNISVKSGERVEEEKEVCNLSFIGTSATLRAKYNGIITWYKIPGQQLYDGDYLASIELR